MTNQVTIELDASELARAHEAAEAHGLPMEDYLKSLIAAHLPIRTSGSQQKALLLKIIALGSSEHPTDIAKEKDALIGEAVWEEHLRETKRE